MWTLICRAPSGEKHIYLENEEYAIGSDPTCDIYLPFPGVRRVHALLTRDTHSYFIHPLKGVAKPMLNEKAIHDPVSLKDGDRFSLGDVVLEIQMKKAEPLAMESLWLSALAKILEQYVSVLGVLDLETLLDLVRQIALKESLKRTNGNIRAAADLLGISRNGLYHLMDRLDIHR